MRGVIDHLGGFGVVVDQFALPVGAIVLAPEANLSGKPILMLSGATDPIVPPESATRLACAFDRAGAAVEHRIVPVGHGLSQPDVTFTEAWLRRRQPVHA